MSQPLPSPDNAASWRQLRASMEEGRSGDSSPWQRMFMAVVTELAGGGLTGIFRAARTADRLVFSTVEHGQLADEPRVTLTFLPEDETVKVAYGRGDIESRAPWIEAWVSATVAGQVTLGALRRLWTETKPGVPLPEELRERKPPAQG